jgi:hypothetical protein
MPRTAFRSQVFERVVSAFHFLLELVFSFVSFRSPFICVIQSEAKNPGSFINFLPNFNGLGDYPARNKKTAMAQFSFESKLSRADHHFQVLEKNLAAWSSSKPYSIFEEIDPDSGDDVVRIKFDSLPGEIAPTIGDCLYNLRSCLDHLAHALALKNRGSLSDEESTQIAFPILQYKDGFTARGLGRIRLLSDSAQAIIESLQPYHAGDAAVSHWLWLLEKLQNIDKHRALLLVPIDQRKVTLDNPRRAALKLMKFSAVIDATEDYAEVARYVFVNPEDGTRVKVNIEVAPNISFGNPPAERRDVLVTLRGIRQHIASKIIPPLQSLL